MGNVRRSKNQTLAARDWTSTRGTSLNKMHSKGNLKEYEIMGTRKISPAEADRSNPLYRFKIFASDEVKAVSGFKNTVRQLLKIKKSDAQIVCVKQIVEQNPECEARNYGIYAIIRQIKSGRVHKSYKEIREVSKINAVRQFCDTTCGQYNVDNNQIHIVKVDHITDSSKLQKPSTILFENGSLSFPKVGKTSTLQDKRFKGLMPFKPVIRR